METTSLSVGEFFSQAVPLTVATAIVAYCCSRGILKEWFPRIFVSLVLGVLATLVMYWSGTGSLHGTSDMWNNTSGGIAGTFALGLRFLTLYYLIAGPWMVLGCLVAGIVIGIVLDKAIK